MEINPKKLIQMLSKKEDEKLNCEYDFLDEEHKLEEQLYFIERVDSALVKAYIISSIVFALPAVLRMFIDLSGGMAVLIYDAIFLKGLAVLSGWLGCKYHKHIFPAISIFMALGGIMAYERAGKGILRILWAVFGSNVLYFIAILIIACTSIAVNIKFTGLNEHSKSASYRLADSKLEFQEHMAKMDRTRKAFLEEEKLNSTELYIHKETGSSDLGATRQTKDTLMDDI